jgi:hypothetical protein
MASSSNSCSSGRFESPSFFTDAQYVRDLG